MTDYWSDEADDTPAAEARLRQGYGINPEQAARMERLARRAGVTPAVAETQAPVLEPMIEAQDATKALANAPATRSFIAADQGNANLVRDHVSDAAKFEAAMAKLPKGYPVMRPPSAGRPATPGNVLKGLWTQFRTADVAAEAGLHQMLAEVLGFDKFAAESQRKGEIARAKGRAAQPDIKNRFLASVYGGFSSALQTAPAVAAGVATRSPGVTMGIMAAQVQGGAYGKYRARGGTEAEAMTGATLETGIELGTEALPLGFLVKNFGKTGFKSFVAGMLAREIPSEQAATFLQDAVDTAIANPNKTWAEFWAERPEAAMDTAVATVIQGGLIGSAGTVANRIARRQRDADQRAAAAPETAEQFNALAQAATELPLRERAPERFRELMDKVAVNTEVYVPAAAVASYLQTATPEEAAAFIEQTGIEPQLNASTPDADIVIPAGAYLAHVAPTAAHAALKDDLRVGPASMSVNEAKAHTEGRDAALAEAADRVMGASAQANAQAEPIERVRAHVEQAAIAAGVPEAQAREYAAVQAQHYAQRAQRNTRFGGDAWAAYEETNPAIKGKRGIGQGPRTTTAPGSADRGTFAQSGVTEDGDHPDRIAQRLPTAKKAAEDPLDPALQVSVEALAQTPALLEKNVGLVRSYPGIRSTPVETAPETARNFIEFVKRNLLWLHDQVDPQTRERSQLWYDGARVIADRWSDRYSLPDRAIAGALAALSPQKDWFQNVSLAERVLDTLNERADAGMDDAMRETADRIFPVEKYAAVREALEGKTLREMSDGLAAAFVRIYDETYNEPAFKVLTPEGEFGDWVLTKKGERRRVAWGSLNEIGKAVSVARDPSRENINSRMGGKHKVRNFYNNILAPNAPHGDVTIDTHAVAAGLLRGLSGNDLEVAHNFNNSVPAGQQSAGGASATGVEGLYAIYADAYREAAAERGILPRQMQSITWEAVRGLFTDQFKLHNKKAVKQIDAIWTEVSNGQITEEQARDRIEQLAGGIADPDWVGSNPRPNEGAEARSYAGKLLGPRLSDGSPLPVDRGAGGGAAGGATGLGGTFQQSGSRVTTVPLPDENGMVTLSHWSSKGRIKQLDPAMWGENWEVLPDEEKARVGEAPGRVYFGFGTGANGEYQPEYGIGSHRYQTQIQFDRLYDLNRDPDKLRAQARKDVKATLDKGESLDDYNDDVTSRLETLVQERGYAGYWSNDPEIGLVAAVYETLPTTYQGRYETPAASAASIQHFTPANLPELLDRTGWAMMTAENPAARTDVSAKDNAKFNKALEKELRKRGLSFHKVQGHYGQEENSYLVLGVTEADALALGQQFGQESVLTRRGLVYADGTYQPATGVTVHAKAPKDFYTRIPATGGLFTVDIDFDTRLPLPAAEPAVFKQSPFTGSKVPGVVYHGTKTAFDKFELDAPRNYDGGAGAGNTDTGWYGKGVYFTPYGRVAGNAYTGGLNAEGGNVIPAYVNLQNPLEITVKDPDSGATSMRRAIVAAGGKFTDSPTEQTAEAQRLGYDGVIVSRDTGDKVYIEEVIAFDPKQIASAITGGIMGQGARGQVGFSTEGALIELFKGANASTLIHEGAGHIWLEELARDAADELATQEVREDWMKVRQWWAQNVEQAEAEVTDPVVKARIAADPTYLTQVAMTFGQNEADPAVRLEAIRPFHEMFARGAERYFMEGKAPNSTLKTAMRRFRDWIVSVYRDVARLNVNMTDEMRDVFDRLTAVQETMADVIDEQGYTPFFADAESAGMTEAEYAAYLRSITDADSDASDQLLGRVMGQVRRRRTAEWKAERDTLIDELSPIIDADPEMRALTLLESGEVFLNRADVGDEAQLYKRFKPYVSNDGIHPDILAEQVGIATGADLLQALRDMKAEHDALRAGDDKRTVRRARVEAAADAEMLRRHGDILNDGTIGDEAQKIVHDLRRSEVLMGEVRALVRRAGAATQIWTQEEMERWARDRIGALSMQEVRPHIYQAAEAKAGRDALKALVKDDFQTALDAKFRQLLNMQLYRAARDAREEFDKGTALFTRIVKAKNGSISKSRNMDMVEAARAILAPYGFGSTRNDNDYMTKVRLYDPDLWQDLEAGIAEALARAKPVEELTYDEFDSLREMVTQLWELSIESRRMEIDGERAHVDDVVDQLTTRLADIGIPAPTGPTANASKRDQVGRIMQGFRAHMRRVESWVSAMDGGPKGPFRRYIWNPVSEAADRYRAARLEHLNALAALVDPMRESLRPGRINAPELGVQGHVFGNANNGIGKSELLHALLHTGNESNKRKLLLGREWAVERADGSLDTTAWDTFLQRMHNENVITQADWDFVQGVWDLLERMKPDAQRAHRQVFGRYFEEVTADPVDTPFGQYRGGYVPAIVDTFFVQEQALNAAVQAVEEGNSSNMFPSPNRGFTKARVEYNRPLALDLGILPSHIDKVLKFTYMTAPVRQVLRLLKNRGLSAPLEALDPVAVPSMLLPWLNRAARQIVETPARDKAGEGMDNVLRAVRSRAGMGIMMFNLSNTMQQLTGWLPASLKVRKRHLTRALFRYSRNPSAMAEEVANLSDFMAARTSTQMMDVAEQLDRMLFAPTAVQRFTNFSQRHAYILQSQFQNVVDLVAWTGAFEQAVQRGETEAEAVRSADSVIRETQGSLNPEDVSAWETGTPLKRLFTQFFSYFSSQGNLLTTEFRNSATLTRTGYVYFMGIMLPAVISEIIRRSFGQGWDDEDDDGYLDTFLDVLFGSQARYLTGMVPLVGQVVNTAINQFDDKRFNDELVPSPVISSVSQAAQAPFSLWRALTEGKGQKAAVRDTATLMTLLTGVPLFNVVARPAGYLADVNEGKVSPTDPVDLARGLATGTASEASKVE